MPNLIACRIASYGKYQDAGWTHLPAVGIRDVEIPVPGPEDVEAVKARLARHGLTASSVQVSCNFGEPDPLNSFVSQLDACRALGAPIALAIIRPGHLERSALWEAMRRIGDAAAERGITIALETHPDLVTNGQTAVATMRAIGHRNVRINFDTANICFYNEGADTLVELEKMIDYVVSFHLKDSFGAYRKFDFPALGRGIVPFTSVFAMMKERSFTGPYTLELEGLENVERDEAQVKRDVEDSTAYLRSIGAME